MFNMNSSFNNPPKPLGKTEEEMQVEAALEAKKTVAINVSAQPAPVSPSVVGVSSPQAPVSAPVSAAASFVQNTAPEAHTPVTESPVAPAPENPSTSA